MSRETLRWCIYVVCTSALCVVVAIHGEPSMPVPIMFPSANPSVLPLLPLLPVEPMDAGLDAPADGATP
jgi:hypothetical protein